MIPQNVMLNVIEQEQYPSLTYKLDLVKKRIMGKVDGLEAFVQAVWKLLLTERYSTPIYSTNYGVELDGMIGLPLSLAKADLVRRLDEALNIDDRYSGVTNVLIEEKDMNTLSVTMTVNSVNGSETMVTEVSI